MSFCACPSGILIQTSSRSAGQAHLERGRASGGLWWVVFRRPDEGRDDARSQRAAIASYVDATSKGCNLFTNNARAASEWAYRRVRPSRALEKHSACHDPYHSGSSNSCSSSYSACSPIPNVRAHVHIDHRLHPAEETTRRPPRRRRFWPLTLFPYRPLHSQGSGLELHQTRQAFD